MIDRNFVLNLAQESSDTNEYLLSLYNIPKQMKAKNIIEIGSGRSTFALVAAANEIEGHVTSIDVGGWDTLNRVEDGEELMKQEPRFTMIKSKSLDFPAIADIDFLFLDSEHTYQLTREEIMKWFPHVKHRGIIMMHDTAHESGQQMECRKALDEFVNSGGQYLPIHLLDTKLIGMTIIAKLWI